MPHRPRNDWPRLSGRPGTPPRAEERETQTVFRRFFELLERFDKPHEGPRPPGAKASLPAPRREGR